jgi:hypothetical protein
MANRQFSAPTTSADDLAGGAPEAVDIMPPPLMPPPLPVRQAGLGLRTGPGLRASVAATPGNTSEEEDGVGTERETRTSVLPRATVYTVRMGSTDHEICVFDPKSIPGLLHEED